MDGENAAVVIETQRTIVRPWRADDADRLFDMRRREEVAKWLSSNARAVRDRAEAVDRIARWRDRSRDDPRFGTWAIEETATGVVAGAVKLAPLPNGDGEVEVGWQLHPDAWGRGLASEAARGALARGFAFGLPCIYALTHATNTRSIRVCRAIGMRDLGVVHDRWYEGESQLFRITSAEYDAVRDAPPQDHLRSGS